MSSSPLPAVLFEAKDNFRKSNKAQQAYTIEKYTNKKSKKVNMYSTPPTKHYVIGDGSLLHRLLWKRTTTVLKLYAHAQNLP